MQILRLARAVACTNLVVCLGLIPLFLWVCSMEAPQSNLLVWAVISSSMAVLTTIVALMVVFCSDLDTECKFLNVFLRQSSPYANILTLQ